MIELIVLVVAIVIIVKFWEVFAGLIVVVLFWGGVGTLWLMAHYNLGFFA